MLWSPLCFRHLRSGTESRFVALAPPSVLACQCSLMPVSPNCFIHPCDIECCPRPHPSCRGHTLALPQCRSSFSPIYPMHAARWRTGWCMQASSLGQTCHALAVEYRVFCALYYFIVDFSICLYWYTCVGRATVTTEVTPWRAQNCSMLTDGVTNKTWWGCDCQALFSGDMAYLMLEIPLHSWKYDHNRI